MASAKLKGQHHLAQAEQVGHAPLAASPMITIAGMIARSRVMSRRTQGWIRSAHEPFHDHLPARVPVIVLLWPLASSATAKRMLASAVPGAGPA